MSLGEIIAPILAALTTLILLAGGLALIFMAALGCFENTAGAFDLAMAFGFLMILGAFFLTICVATFLTC
ncbi:hypothetical protein [Bifidobacterium eulemuris]|uniref:Uncharacterized protein n=1 Tax=Bifidobacterium eulemuris TaxID=1765219 RepID=A0A261G9W6_9BIFI|nr:hypothetical protein [Bifidobacterium eulemuris]OZG68222.1 hypothetical protein BEUL_1235 [Bifidobacterium eulemuris]QOL31721.1 hypothetical protein BE0216_04015 [Bifidobacterium eulemuris]